MAEEIRAIEERLAQVMEQVDSVRIQLSAIQSPNMIRRLLNLEMNANFVNSRLASLQQEVNDVAIQSAEESRPQLPPTPNYGDEVPRTDSEYVTESGTKTIETDANALLFRLAGSNSPTPVVLQPTDFADANGKYLVVLLQKAADGTFREIKYGDLSDFGALSDAETRWYDENGSNPVTSETEPAGLLQSGAFWMSILKVDAGANKLVLHNYQRCIE